MLFHFYKQVPIALKVDGCPISVSEKAMTFQVNNLINRGLNVFEFLNETKHCNFLQNKVFNSKTIHILKNSFSIEN